MDILLNKLIRFYLNNTINLRHLSKKWRSYRDHRLCDVTSPCAYSHSVGQHHFLLVYCLLFELLLCDVEVFAISLFCSSKYADEIYFNILQKRFITSSA